MATFITDCLDVTGDPNDEVLRSTVYGRYVDWCKASGHKALGNNKFWPDLVEHDRRIIVERPDGTVPARHGGQRLTLGLRLVENWQ